MPIRSPLMLYGDCAQMNSKPAAGEECGMHSVSTSAVYLWLTGDVDEELGKGDHHKRQEDPVHTDVELACFSTPCIEHAHLVSASMWPNALKEEQHQDTHEG